MIGPADAARRTVSDAHDAGRRVLQVSTADLGGGAERIAVDLHAAYAEAGWSARLMVGHRHGDLAGVVAIPGDEARHPAARAGVAVAGLLRPTAPRLATAVAGAAQPVRTAHRLLGREDFAYPGSRVVVEAAADADLVHAHNLHGRYFDLRLLGEVSRRAPLLLTLHDAWLTTGHCAHSIGCDRWRTGCGSCPDLTLYPAVRRDATAANFRRKRSIVGASAGIRVATPSQWLLDRVQDSMLAEHLLGARVIANGVDLSAFAPRPAGAAKAALGLPADQPVVLGVGTGLRANPYKDYPTLEAALQALGSDPAVPPTQVVLLGDEHPELRFGAVTVRFVAGVSGDAATSRYYDAADVLVHPARSDTFPTTVLEALASGVPVVASAVGGIPEQVGTGAGAGGQLVPPGDPAALARHLADLLGDQVRRGALGAQARVRAEERFDVRRQHAAYLAWAAEIVADAPARGRS